MNDRHHYRTNSWVGFTACLIGAFLVSWHFHNRFWWGPDDGYFGHIAQLILNGEILHKDIPVVHSGLNYLINAFFLSVADGDLVGLRYPLIALTVIQTGCAYKMAEKHGLLISVVAAIIAFSFSFIQFINPTPHWYTLSVTFILAYILSQKDIRKSKAILLIGLLIGVTFLLRQLTGVILAVAATAIIFLKNSDFDSDDKLVGGKIILAALTLVLTLYVFKVAKLTGLLVVGIYPLVVLLFCIRSCAIGWKRSTEITGLLILGAILSAIPLTIYYGINGALFDWLYGMLISPLNFVDQTIFQKPNFFILPAFAIKELFSGNLAGIGGLLFWLPIIFAPMVLGTIVIRQMTGSRSNIPVIGIIGSVYSLVAIHYEIHLYLLFCTAIVFIGILLSVEQEKTKKSSALFMGVLSVVAIFFHAGQSLERDLSGIATNERLDYNLVRLPTTTIIIPNIDANNYLDVLDVIDRCSTPSDTIYAFPMNPELYFLSGKQSPFKFIVSFIGLSSQDDLSNSTAIIHSENAPALIFHNENDKYNSILATQLLDNAKPFYRKVGTVSDWTIYQRRNQINSATCAIPPNRVQQ